MLLKYYVEDRTRSKRIYKVVSYKNSNYYLFVSHPDLTKFQNIMVNLGLAMILEK